MKKQILIAFVMLIAVIGLAEISFPKNTGSVGNKSQVKHALTKPQMARPYPDPADLRAEGVWNKPSEKKPHPKIKHLKNLIVRVSLMGNRVYLMQNNRVLYTMLSTAGKFKNGKSLTPVGIFKVKHDRGEVFFNENLNEGAKNWVSWSKNNVYLFHSIPTKADGKFNLKEGEKLGKTQGSHGCVRLSVPDSKWLMENLPTSTKVIIKNE